jgi:hypothetical protein
MDDGHCVHDQDQMNVQQDHRYPRSRRGSYRCYYLVHISLLGRQSDTSKYVVNDTGKVKLIVVSSRSHQHACTTDATHFSWESFSILFYEYFFSLAIICKVLCDLFAVLHLSVRYLRSPSCARQNASYKLKW